MASLPPPSAGASTVSSSSLAPPSAPLTWATLAAPAAAAHGSLRPACQASHSVVDAHAPRRPNISSEGPPQVPPHVRWLWIAGVASGLRALHHAGWIHNDVKPANIFCGPDGAVKLGDFGLATAIATAPSGAGAAGQGDAGLAAKVLPVAPLAATPSPTAGSPPAAGAQGTPTYMAPERHQPPAALSAEPAGARSDVYSLGVCLAEVHGGFATAMERAAHLSALKRRATNAQLGVATGAPPAGQPGGGLADPVAEQLALRMLATSPAARPTALQVERVCRAMAKAKTSESPSHRAASDYNASAQAGL